MKELGRAAGFDLVRIAEAEPLQSELDRYHVWIDQGRQGDMQWISHEHAERSAHPGQTLPSARAVICVAVSYWGGPRPAEQENTGKVARYAWGEDYHEVLGRRLAEFAGALEREFGGQHKWYVDTGPLMDKALASRSGLGWYGRNTNILSTEFGSWILLGEIVTTLEIEPDPPLQLGCGSCRLCVVACPTAALSPDYSIDSRRCISYLTIEHRGPIPAEYRPLIGSWVFGCDICQDVCPPSMNVHLHTSERRREWTTEVRRHLKREPPSLQVALRAVSESPSDLREGVDLLWLLNMNHEQYLQAFRGTSIRRAKAWMLRRNAAVALGNVGTMTAREPLLRTVREDEEPIVRGHSAWALGRLAERDVAPLPLQALTEALKGEQSRYVREEIHALLAG